MARTRRKRNIVICLTLFLVAILVIPNIGTTMAKEKDESTTINRKKQAEEKAKTKQITLMFIVNRTDSSGAYYYNVATDADIEKADTDAYGNTRTLTLNYKDPKELKIVITCEDKNIAPSKETTKNQTYKDGWSTNAKILGGFKYCSISGLIYIEPVGNETLKGTTFYLSIGENVKPVLGTSTILTNDTDRNYHQEYFTTKTVSIKQRKPSNNGSIWDNVKNKLSVFTGTITMITNMYLGIGLMVSFMILIINIVRLAASPSHPIKRVAVVQDLVCCAVCIAGLGATWRITKLIILLVASPTV